MLKTPLGNIQSFLIIIIIIIKQYFICNCQLQATVINVALSKLQFNVQFVVYIMLGKTL